MLSSLCFFCFKKLTYASEIFVQQLNISMDNLQR